MTPPADSPATAAPDPLASLLPTRDDSDRPWLVDYSGPGRVELTGHVLAMWAAKVTGFLLEQAPPSPLVELSTRSSWRAVIWALGTWGAGGTLRRRNDRLTAEAAGEQTTRTDVAVALNPDDLDPDAELQVLLPSGPLALAWDGPDPLPPLVVDGVADLMTYPDQAPTTPVHGSDTALEALCMPSAPPVPFPAGTNEVASDEDIPQAQAHHTDALAAPRLHQAHMIPLSRSQMYHLACLKAGEQARTWSGWKIGQDGRPYPTTPQARGTRPRAQLIQAESSTQTAIASDNSRPVLTQPTGHVPSSAEASDGVVSHCGLLNDILGAWAGRQCAIILPAGATPQRKMSIATQEGAHMPGVEEGTA